MLYEGYHYAMITPTATPTIIEYWPIILFGCGTFLGSIGVAVGLTMWIMGRLSEQDARRIEMKEAILKEMRDLHKEASEQMKVDRHTLGGRLDQQYKILDEKIDDLKERLISVEIHMGLPKANKS